MEDTPISALFIALLACLASSAFFSAAETAMMAINRYRLAGKVRQGHRAAVRTQKLLNETEKLLGVILLGNTVINTVSATLAALITARLFSGNEFALGTATLLVAFAILVFSEATPKVIAATHAEAVAYLASGPLVILLRVFYPAVWIVNLIVDTLLRALRLRKPGGDSTALSPDELRLLVLESGRFMEKKHHTILLNLFELANVTVDDVMTPRHQMEMVDLTLPSDLLRQELFTSHHSRLPIYAGNPDNVLGILPARKLLSLTEADTDADAVRTLMRQPYFIPSGTPLFTQLQNFQENHRRLGLVVDEYGELLGLVTLEDILEQMIGEFTTQSPASGVQLARQADGSLLLDGSISLRDLNRKLKLGLPTSGPKTLNGLILEYFEDIPETGTCMVIAGQRLEVVQTQDRSIRMVRLYPQ
ncbi:HlyC/CorC family transporter [Jeongeupia naejangsanensis]|uniref:HlyC/CorC family transporter n=1 Tax=Jeongeupia naejangsanensis TaxID=613195 RepID=A0ABS2BQ09_9NEIS|nr:HlyC/CorC family transporter [Jeongeupia naejangsanensis]MBM3117719.1 HlyC/CorC family transporter [Jeongeupia naejangsanensis]